MVNRIFNPLDEVSITASVSSGSNDLKSESSLNNEDYGKCPKCKAKFELTKLADDTPAFWCGTCKVAAPKKL